MCYKSLPPVFPESRGSVLWERVEYQLSVGAMVLSTGAVLSELFSLSQVVVAGRLVTGGEEG